MTVDVYATGPHYVDHIEPIWRALPESHRGDWLTKDRRMGALLDTRGLPWRLRSPSKDRDRPIMVAAYRDLRELGRRRPVVFVEHGAGQSYADMPDDPSYSGGGRRGNVDLFLCPNEMVAARNAARYPAARVEVVGCPKLDRWLALPTKPRNRPDTIVAFAFHWDYAAVPEARSAWPHYAAEVARLARLRSLTVVGHCHPRDHRGWARWGELGIDVFRTLDDVFATADVLAVDNSSAGYEFAALGRPTVWMNAPWYRRDVEHGLRFWNLIPGVQVDEPNMLRLAVHEAMCDGPPVQAVRRRVVDAVYPIRDGSSSARAAAAVVDLVSRF